MKDQIKIEENRRIALLDGDFLPYYVCYNKRDENGITVEKSFDDCKLLVDSFVETILKLTEATHYVMAFTVGKNFRYQINPYYKANRKKDKEPIPFLKETKGYLIMQYKGIWDTYYEADDIVATLKKRMPSESFIVSPDKDLLNLEGQHYNPKKNEWVATLGDQAECYFWRSMIIGDATDNIKGLPDKGEAYANKITNEELLKHGKQLIFGLYCNYYEDESQAIDEFYLNYKCLKIIDKSDMIEMSELQMVKVSKEEKV